jgi:hypothetical protein
VPEAAGELDELFCSVVAQPARQKAAASNKDEVFFPNSVLVIIVVYSVKIPTTAKIFNRKHEIFANEFRAGRHNRN